MEMEIDVPYIQMKERALRLLAIRDHSVSELRTKLRQKLRQEYDDSIFKRVVESLQSIGYLVNEVELSNRWVAAWRKEGRGRHWISGKLRTKGLPQVTLRDEDEGEIEAAETFLAKKSREKDLAKLGRALISRGFSQSLVATLIRKKKKELTHDEGF